MRKSLAILAAACVLGNLPGTHGALVNTPPTVTLVSPISGATYRSGGDITILAFANDADGHGQVRVIEFFDNERSLGEVRREPQSSLMFDFVRFVWKSPTAGTHQLVAVATDSEGASAKSKPVMITVLGDVSEAASIVITSPRNGAVFPPLGPISITATARDPKSYINRVEFFANEERIGISEILFFRAPDPGERIVHTFEWIGARPGDFKLTVRGKDLQGANVISEAVTIRVKEIEIKPFVERRLPSGYSPGIAFPVELSANPPASVTVYALEERLPDGWSSVGEINNDGVFDAVNREVKFGPFFDNKPRVFRYLVTPPPGVRGQKTFSGHASADGFSSAIGGASQIDSALLHPADNVPADFVMTLNEVTAYGLAWKRGIRWPVDPNPIPIDYVTRAGALWRGGEKYYFESGAGPAPKWWINAIPRNTEPLGVMNVSKAMMPARSTGNSIHRGLRITGGAKPLLQASISVQPNDWAIAQAVEERIPESIDVSAISHQGVFDPKAGVLRWGPFLDHQPRVLTYEAAIPTGARMPLRFAGVGSFDGSSVAISGPVEFIPENPGLGPTMGSLQVSRDGSVEILGRGEPGQMYVIEATEDFLTWNELTRLTSSETTIQFRDRNDGTMHQRFYRIRRVMTDE